MSDEQEPVVQETRRARRERMLSRPSPQRRLVIPAAVVAVIAATGGLYTFYRVSSQHTASPEVPLIQADDQPTRKRPTEPGGMPIPDQDKIVLNHTEPKVEQLLPPPESPLPKPAPSQASPPDHPKAAESTAQPPSAPAPSVAAAPAPAPATQPSSPSTPTPAPAAQKPPSPTPAVAKPSTSAPSPSAGKGVRLQVAAVRTPEGARREWQRLKEQYGDLLGTLPYTVVKVNLGEKGIFYRVQAGPIANATVAERKCNELKRRGVGCILVKS